MSPRRFRFDIRQAGPQILIFLLVLLAFNVGFYLLATRPRVNEFRSLAKGSEPQLSELQGRTREVEVREAFFEALQKAEQDLQRLRTEILSTREARLVEVQRELEALCRQFKIDLDSVTFDDEVLQNEGLDKMIMVVPLKGNYTSLRNFLQAVESSEKFMLVERVALAEGKEGGVMLELSITLATYFDLPDLPNRRGNRPERSVRRRA
jgi:Tfp pilus assembly protein PilO